MPEISEFYGIRVVMFWNDHTPPHFHAEYAGNKVLIDIEKGSVLKGVFPFKQLKLVLAWNEIHKDELMKNWEFGREHLDFVKIKPLV